MNNRYKILNKTKYLLFLFLVSVSAFFISKIGNSTSNEIEKINNYFDTELQQLSNLDGWNSYIDINSIFSIAIEKAGVDIYWNNNYGDINKGKILYDTIIESSNERIKISLPLFNKSGELLDPVKDFFSLKNNYQLAGNDGVDLKTIKIGFEKFQVEKINRNPKSHFFSVFIISLILFYFYVLFYTIQSIENYKTWTIFIVGLLAARSVLFLISTVQKWSEYSFFIKVNDLTFINGSIADFWINIITLGIIFTSLINIPRVSFKSKIQKRGIEILNGFIIGLSFVYYCYISRGFILSDKVNINVEKVLTFDIQSIALLLALVCGHLLIFVYTVYSIKWTRRLKHGYSLMLLAGTGIVFSSIFANFLISFHPLILGAYVVAFVMMVDLFLDSKNKNIMWLIWWSLVISAFTSNLIYYNSLKKDIIIRRASLENSAIKSKEADKKTILDIDKDILNSSFPSIISNLPYPSIVDQKDVKSYAENLLKEKQRKGINLEEIIIFDSNNNSIFVNSNSTYFDINQSIKMSDRIGQNIFYNSFKQKYLILYEISPKKYPNGPFQLGLIFTPQDYKPRSFNSDQLLIKNDELIFPSIYRPDPELIQKIKTEAEDFYFKGNSIVKKSFSNNTTLISIKKVASLIKPMSLFSYVFTITGLLVFLIALGNSNKDFIPEPLNIRIIERRTLRNRIQVSLITLIIFSFIVIGLMTAIYFKNILEENDSSKEEETIFELIEKLNTGIQSSTNPQMALNNVKQKISTVEFLISSEIELFDAKGFLVSTSDKSITKNKRIPYEIYSQKTDFQIEGSRYIPLNSVEGTPFGFIHIQNNKEKGFSQSIFDFLSTLLNVYVFLFLLAGAMAIAISNSITKPLATLTDKLRGYRLGKKNEPLEWNTDDEIGNLIKDYNNLILKLDESAYIIAKTERDTAWREMAKQVAHEIKNPLTPMKLSIQYLQRALTDPKADKEALFSRVSQTMLEQINNLSEIANEFSNFAKMPQSNNEKIILNEIVEAIHDLFRKREDMDILMSEPINEIYVFADRGQLVRILNNLVKNAIQAIPNDRRGKIIISLYNRNQNAVVKVSDNGIGIPDSMKSKVFTPNFTTKSSGTGLGLAISANIIDGFNGKIYFDTKDGIGTDFYIEIPMMRLEEQYISDNRVMLD